MNKDTCNTNTQDTPTTVPMTKPNKRKIFSNIFSAVAIAVGVVTMISLGSSITDEGIMAFPEVVATLDIKYVIISILLLVISIVLNATKYFVVTHTIEGEARIATSLKVALVGKYYDNITPFAAGGQPMQILYLHKKGHSGGSASAIIAVKYFANTFAWLLVGVIFMLNTNALSTLDSATRTLFLWAGWVGWALNSVVPILIILFVAAPKTTERFVAWIIMIGHKIRIVKDKEAILDRARQLVDDFRTSFLIMRKQPFKFVKLVLLCLIEPLITYAFPYFIMLSMASGVVEQSVGMMMVVITLNVYSAFSSSVVPTPGGSVVIEALVLLAFANIAGGVLFWVVFVWRFFVYYIYIIIGIGIVAFEMIRNQIRYKRAKNNLPQ